MKKFILTAATVAVFVFSGTTVSRAENLVIIHTNDLHSHVDPDVKSGLGGYERHKVVIDSIRTANPHTLLINAGDAVQGSLYFTLFKGEVERKVLNAMGYDIVILGNHEFDNGMDLLAHEYGALDAELLSSNYDFSDTPLDGLFLPYSIREIEGKRIAFIAINIDPDGIIDPDNVKGLKYEDGLKTANTLAGLLKKKEKADLVVAITHIGYDTSKDGGIDDVKLAKGSYDIDVIIGGHSHTTINPADTSTPAYLVPNLNGEPVLIAQTGRYGNNVGEVVIDLDTHKAVSRLHKIDSRYDSRVDGTIADAVAPFKNSVDSLASIKIGKSSMEMLASQPSLLNFASDFVKDFAQEQSGMNVDFAIMNKGGLRADLPKGTVTKGMIMTIFPFDNKVEIIEMTGKDVKDLLDILASTGGNGVSREVEAVMDSNAKNCVAIYINGKPLDENAIYNVATIDYLAKGGDDMKPFVGRPILYKSENPLCNDLILYIEGLDKQGKKLKAPNEARMHY